MILHLSELLEFAMRFAFGFSWHRSSDFASTLAGRYAVRLRRMSPPKAALSSAHLAKRPSVGGYFRDHAHLSRQARIRIENVHYSFFIIHFSLFIFHYSFSICHALALLRLPPRHGPRFHRPHALLPLLAKEQEVIMYTSNIWQR